MTTNGNDLEPLDPETGKELFLDHKSTHCTDATIQSHRYRMDHFIQWCNKEEIDNLNHLTGRDLHRYRLWRKEDGDLNQLTLRMQMSTLRVFLKWAGSIEAVPENLYDKVLVPDVSRKQRKRDETLEAEDAEEILQYLGKYEYASRKHALIGVLWETGIRVGAAHSLDIDDVQVENDCLRLVHRPETDTTLKNGESGERLIAIRPALRTLLTDYIEDVRSDITDEHGREPLFVSSQGRLSRNALRRIVYQLTAPCYRGEECPGCEGYDAKCDESVSPHAVRRGSITHFLTSDVPDQVVSERMNVSSKVIDLHYDKRSEETKLEQRRGYLDNI